MVSLGSKLIDIAGKRAVKSNIDVSVVIRESITSPFLTTYRLNISIYGVLVERINCLEAIPLYIIVDFTHI
jgi:hypothetical protein